MALVDLLATFYQAGNLEQTEVIARSMLAAIPDDIVALQFLGLALYQMGRINDAYLAFKEVAAKFNAPSATAPPNSCEPAAVVSYREATRPGSGLADGWQRISQLLAQFGFHEPAAHALAAARLEDAV